MANLQGQFLGQSFVALNQAVERPAGQQFHHHVILTGGFADKMDLDDVGMADGGGGTRLLKEIIEELRVVRQIPAQNFDRDLAV